MDDDRWIVIPNWDTFQHYRDRDPVWIKNYRDLLAKDEYRELTLVQRGALHGIWLEYAAANRQLRDSTLSVSRRIGQRVTRATLDALNHAGFIDYSASKPLAPRYHDASPEGEREEETEREEQDQEQDQEQVCLTSTEKAAPNGRQTDLDLTTIKDQILQSLEEARLQ